MTSTDTEQARIGALRRTGDVVVVVAFAAIICAPMAFQLSEHKGIELVEKRTLASLPVRPNTLDAWAAFPAAADQYFGDRFGLRGELISTNSYLHYLLGISASPRVLVGSHGWLFYISDPQFKFFRGRNQLSQEEIHNWIGQMEDRQRWLAERQAKLVILPAPLKETIYPELLPYWLRRERASTLVDQLVSAAAGHVPIVDVRNQLVHRKQQASTYAPFDTHWNAEGAFVAYSALVQQFNRMGAALRPLTREAVVLHATPPEHLQRDLVLMLGVHPFVKVDGFAYTPRSAASGSKVEYLTARTDANSPQIFRSGIPGTPTLMMVGDSFSMALLPYLRDTFGTIIWMHLQDGFFPKQYMEKYHPDFVLMEVQEGGLGVI